MREREVGVRRDRALEVVDRLGDRLAREADVELSPLEKDRVRAEVERRPAQHALALVRRQLRPERGGDAQRDLALDLEDVRHLPVEAVGPEQTFGIESDELRDDAHAVAGATYAAVEHRRRAERVADLVEGLLALPEPHDGGVRDHLERWIFESWAMTSSVIPSAKKSFSGSAVRLRKGSTATEATVGRGVATGIDGALRRGAKPLGELDHLGVRLEIEIGAHAVRVLERVLARAGAVARGVEREHQRAGVRARMRIGGDELATGADAAVDVAGVLLALGQLRAARRRTRARARRGARRASSRTRWTRRDGSRRAADRRRGGRRARRRRRRSRCAGRGGRRRRACGSSSSPSPDEAMASSPSAVRSTWTERLSSRRALAVSFSGQSSASARSRASGCGQVATTRVSSAMR